MVSGTKVNEQQYNQRSLYCIPYIDLIRFALLVSFNTEDQLSAHYSSPSSVLKTPIKSVESILNGDPSIIPFLYRFAGE